MILGTVRYIVRPMGWVLFAHGFIMFICGIIDLLGNQASFVGFFIGVTVNILFGTFCILSSISLDASSGHKLTRKEHIIFLPTTWVLCGIFGAVPFMYNYPSLTFAGCFMEVISALTTTGISIIHDLPNASRGILFFHSLLAFIGGAWAIVLCFAVASSPAERGNVNELQDRTVYNNNANRWMSIDKIVIKIIVAYCTIIFGCCVSYVACGMDILTAIFTAISTIATSGFISADEFTMINNQQAMMIVSTFFMLLCGLPLVVLFVMLEEDALQVLQAEQIKWFFKVVLFFVILLTFKSLPKGFFANFNLAFFGNALLVNTFNVASGITTTGFGVATFDGYRGIHLKNALVPLLAIIGGCVGSSTGGLKIGRVVVIFKTIGAYVNKQIAPKTVINTFLNSTKVTDDLIKEAMILLVAWVLTMVICSILFICVADIPLSTSSTYVLALMTNSGITDVSEILKSLSGIWYVLACISSSFLMLVGRLEVFAIYCLFAKRLWIK